MTECDCRDMSTDAGACRGAAGCGESDGESGCLTAAEQRRVLSLAGLCRRAGGVIPGADAVIGALRRGGSGKPCLILLAADASERTVKQICDKAAHRTVDVYTPGFGSDEAGRALGVRSPIAVFALNGRGPADAIRDLCSTSGIDDKTNK